MPRDPERFLTLLCRELGAAEALVVEPEAVVQLVQPDAPGVPPPGVAPPPEGTEIRCPMGGGRTVVVRFGQAPVDREAKERRLEILVQAFDAVAVEQQPPQEAGQPKRSRPPAALSLRDELEGLCVRAGAANAMVIDANSPVVWGAARSEGLVEVPPLPSTPSVIGAARADEASGESVVAAASRRALRVVRGLPEMAALRKGKHLRYVQRSGEVPLVAHAFASIYLLVVVFEPGSSFDELRAERSIVEGLPRVERLVMALPPHEPDPTQGAGAIAMRRPRGR